ncbi:GDSL esterase/lipase At5g14450-like [Bidens hawaiensis]|uniref:GDSL esterase/lipase At5g14450-like n=1 Tax=Bidens hawaiensis TaxID=980011 RepID=UPI00404B020F
MGWKTRSLIIAIAALLVTTFFIYFNNNNNNNESSYCEFPAIYNFGDSNSDTGGAAVVFESIPYPYGMTYFHKPSGRFSDGRLIIDFIADKLGLPFLCAYMDSIGTNYRHGANFAVSGATIQLQDAVSLNKTFCFITLSEQLFQFQEFKRRASGFYLEDISNELKARLPRPEDYTRTLYMFDIGQNDLHAGLLLMQEEVMEYIPDMINDLSSAVKQLYEGARTFWILNTGPIGCMPFFVKNYPPAPGNADKRGCVESYNKVAQEFNKQLEDEVSKLGSQLQESTLLYVDVYSLKYSLLSEPTKHGKQLF